MGINTFLNPHATTEKTTVTLSRSSTEEKDEQLARLEAFHARHAAAAPAMLERLRQTAIGDGNIFGALMDAVEHCSLGQITRALFEVGGQYRRNM